MIRVGILWRVRTSVNAREREKQSRRENPRENGPGFVDLFCGYVEMGDGSITQAADRVDQDAFLFQRGDDFGRRAAIADDVEDHDIGFDVLRSDADGRNVLEKAGQLFGVRMIFRQTRDVVLQRVDAGGGQHAGLAHGAAVHAAKAPRTLDELLIA